MQAARQDRLGDHQHPGTADSRCRSAAMATAHVLVFPFPVQGHINCMRPFATALVGAGVHVTFLHTEHNLRKLGRATSAAGSPLLRFASVPDGLPSDHSRSVSSLLELYNSLEAGATREYRALLAPSSSSLTSASSGSVADVRADDDPGSGFGFSPVTCVVADGLLPWALDIAEELGVPAIAFRTASASSFLSFLSVPKLFELGDLPFPAGSGDLDEPVRGVPGMGSFLRRRDLPSFCRRHNGNGTDDGDGVDPTLHELAKLSARSSKARALILNTAASLEQPALSQIAPHMRDLFAIGPLHAMAPAPASASSSSLWREDDGCLAWLDSQADRSVVYVSFGSLTVISQEQFRELLGGLVATGYHFLWVLRPDMVQDDGAVQEHLAEGNDRARIVAWAPQREVLRHRAVGCFLTHAGWNSTLEAVVEGVPMVCWPFFSDQQINSRVVGAVWRNGMDMKDVCDATVAERIVREAMESAEIRRSAEALAQQVKRDVECGGSSEKEFQRLVSLIRVLSTPAATELKSACSSGTPRFRQQ